MRRTIEGLFTYLEFAACAAAWLPILATSTVVHRHESVPRQRGRWLRSFGRATSALTPLWDFSVEGQPPADIGARAYIVLANHASTADPFLLSWLPWDMQWVVKEELMRAPVVGWLIRLGGDIPLRRGEGESVRAMLSSCRHALRHGLSVMIFPEGTRSRDGAVRAFKDGAFQLAIAEGAPVLPIAIAGTRRCMPKGSAWFGRARAIARVLAPIETTGMTLADVPRLRDAVHAEIERAVLELEARLGSADTERRPIALGAGAATAEALTPS